MQAVEISLGEKLKTEVRSCPLCSLEVSNPFIEICPRCSTKLEKLQLECNGCVHRMACPVVPHHHES